MNSDKPIWDDQEEHIGVGILLFFVALCVIFIVLKGNGIIEWTWLWVFAPIWIPAFVLCPLLPILVFIGWVTG